jgi:hypothetical protein
MELVFETATALIDTFLARRGVIVDTIERRLLNVGNKPSSRVRDRAGFEEAMAACFCGATAAPREAAAQLTALDAAHVADGFAPLFRQTHAHQLDVAAWLAHAYEHWDRTRWPGTAGRVRYAGTLYTAYLLRYLQSLTLRLWDGTPAAAPQRLTAVQRLLDSLNAGAPRPFVRTAPWLLHTALGPLTKGLAPYFRVAERIAQTGSGSAGLEIHAAGAMLAAGHLRSQLYHRRAELGPHTAPADVLVVARNSNAMDVALLVWDLVPLLEAYVAVSGTDARDRRAALAEAILHGFSADPELLLTRLDLLGPYTTIEAVFLGLDADGPVRTSTGARHQALLARYASLLDTAAPALLEDTRAFEPARTSRSPLGLVYGFCADIIAAMALDVLHGRETPTSIEDVFAGASTGIEWSMEWAMDVFRHVRGALEARASHPGQSNASSVPSASIVVNLETAAVAGGQPYCITSDVARAVATGATAFPRGQIISDREEGRFLASVEVDGRWWGVSKAVLTERLAQGREAHLAVPDAVSRILSLTCPALVRTAGRG